MGESDFLEKFIKLMNKQTENKPANNNHIIFSLPPDDLPHAIEVLKKHDEPAYEQLNKILEIARSTEITTSMVIQTLDTIENKIN
ncbi:hypothetical protein [Lysinibacillus fusiformis]|uniref:hypothetical protein n=1 Tax=Lysinibacillus fusiformis TaxID=28031 RepID=UPI0021BF1887|nr:hypothetical protein [Lysinibacillus fusiformis]UXJ71328.1 hypothetical protein N5069_24125 [Lysinibacillus fusiformis]